jgi:hypothetical protein
VISDLGEAVSTANFNREGIDSEGNTCYIHFSSLDDAVQTAQLAAEMIKDPERIVAMIAVARENDLKD